MSNLPSFAGKSKNEMPVIKGRLKNVVDPLFGDLISKTPGLEYIKTTEDLQQEQEILQEIQKLEMEQGVTENYSQDLNKTSGRSEIRSEKSDFGGLQRTTGVIFNKGFDEADDVENLLSGLETNFNQRDQKSNQPNVEKNIPEIDNQQKHKKDTFGLPPQPGQKVSFSNQQRPVTSTGREYVSEDDSENSHASSFYNQTKQNRPFTSNIENENFLQNKQIEFQPRKSSDTKDSPSIEKQQSPLQRVKQIHMQQQEQQLNQNQPGDFRQNKGSGEESQIPVILTKNSTRITRTLKDRKNLKSPLQQSQTFSQEANLSIEQQNQEDIQIGSQPRQQFQNQDNQNKFQQEANNFQVAETFQKQPDLQQNFIYQKPKLFDTPPENNEVNPKQTLQLNEFANFEHLPIRKQKELQLLQQKQQQQNTLTQFQMPESKSPTNLFQELKFPTFQQNTLIPGQHQQNYASPAEFQQKMDQLNTDNLSLKYQLESLNREKDIKIREIDGEKRIMDTTNDQIMQDIEDQRRRMEDLEKQNKQTMDKLIQRNQEESKRIQDQYNYSMNFLKQEKQKLIEDLDKNRKLEQQRQQKAHEADLLTREKQLEIELKRQKQIYEEQIENLKLQFKQSELMNSLAATVEFSTSQIQELSMKIQVNQEENFQKKSEELKLREKRIQDLEKRLQIETQSISTERMKLQELAAQLEQNEQKRQEEWNKERIRAYEDYNRIDDLTNQFREAEKRRKEENSLAALEIQQENSKLKQEQQT